MASKILVTGATGFVGGVIARSLEKVSKYRVYTPTRKELDLMDIDSMTTYLSQHEFDTVVHCAGSTNSDVSSFKIFEFQTNVSIITNFLRTKELFGQLINFGSGAEFDRRFDISDPAESDLWIANPIDHYGLSKNIAARIVNSQQNWYNLRLYGVFGSNESDKRLFKKILRREVIQAHDRLFDYFYVEDIVPVVKYILNNSVAEKDIDLVYSQHLTLQEQINMFLKIHNLPNKVRWGAGKDFDYTGNHIKLSKLALPLHGLEKGFQNYI